jgi:predicted GNAT family acetyltransferase
MADDIINNTRGHRFELSVDGHLAKAWYRLAPGTITFTHTDVPEELEGRGIGSRLARFALDHARAEHLSVVALCPFIAGWIGRHPEYKDLLVAEPET